MVLKFMKVSYYLIINSDNLEQLFKYRVKYLNIIKTYFNKNKNIEIKVIFY